MNNETECVCVFVCVFDYVHYQGHIYSFALNIERMCRDAFNYLIDGLARDKTRRAIWFSSQKYVLIECGDLFGIETVCYHTKTKHKAKMAAVFIYIAAGWSRVWP